MFFGINSAQILPKRNYINEKKAKHKIWCLSKWYTFLSIIMIRYQIMNPNHAGIFKSMGYPLSTRGHRRSQGWFMIVTPPSECLNISKFLTAHYSFVRIYVIICLVTILLLGFKLFYIAIIIITTDRLKQLRTCTTYMPVLCNYVPVGHCTMPWLYWHWFIHLDVRQVTRQD